GRVSALRASRPVGSLAPRLHRAARPEARRRTLRDRRRRVRCPLLAGRDRRSPRSSPPPCSPQARGDPLPPGSLPAVGGAARRNRPPSPRARYRSPCRGEDLLQEPGLARSGMETPARGGARTAARIAGAPAVLLVTGQERGGTSLFANGVALTRRIEQDPDW